MRKLGECTWIIQPILATSAPFFLTMRLLVLMPMFLILASSARELNERTEPIVKPNGDSFSCFASYGGGYICDYDHHDYTSSRFSVRCPTSKFEPLACSCSISVRNGGSFGDCRVCALMEADSPIDFHIRYDCSNQFTGSYAKFNSARTEQPSMQPSQRPSTPPTAAPTLKPTLSPTSEPTLSPTSAPTFRPTEGPSAEPTQRIASNDDSKSPTRSPSHVPTHSPDPVDPEDDFFGDDSFGEDSVGDDFFGEDSVVDTPEPEPVTLTIRNTRTRNPTPSPSGSGFGSHWTRLFLRGGD